MHSGPGSGPLLTAAAAWDELATELDFAASCYRSVILELTSRPWMGSAAESMLGAVSPYAAWLSVTAMRAEQAGMQASAAAAAYETAFAMTVPPAAVAANRALLTMLVATNFLGQNALAIAAVETHYAEFWVQDAVAMYYYTSSSAAASVLPAFTSPPDTNNPEGLAEQAVAVGKAATPRRAPLEMSRQWQHV